MDLLDQAQQNKDEPQTTDIPDLSSLMHPAIDTPATDSTPADSAPPTPVTEAPAASVPQPFAASTTSTQPPIDTDSNPPSDPPPIPPSADQPPKPQLHRSRGILMAAIALFLITLPVIGFFVNQRNTQIADIRNRAASCTTQGAPCSVTCNNGESFSDPCPAGGAFATCDAWKNEACASRGGWGGGGTQPTSPPGQITTCQPGSAPNCVGVPFNSQITVQPGNICMKCVKQANNLCGQQFCDDSLNKCQGTCYNNACNSNTSEHPPLNAAPGVCTGTQYCCAGAINPPATSTPTRTPTPIRTQTPFPSPTYSPTCIADGSPVVDERPCCNNLPTIEVSDGIANRNICQTCVAGWKCGNQCATQDVVDLFNNTFCNGRLQWLWESASNQGLGGPACGGSPSSTKSGGCPNLTPTRVPTWTPTPAPVCSGVCYSSTNKELGSAYERRNDTSCLPYEGIQARWCPRTTPTPTNGACKLTGNSASVCNGKNTTTTANVGPCTCKYSSLGGQDCACIANNPTPTGSGVNPTPPIACQDGTGSPDPDYVLLCECENGCYTKTDNSPGGDGRTGWVCDTNCRRVPKNTLPTKECFQIDYVKTGTSNYCGVKDVSSCLKPVCQTNVPPPQPSNTPVNTPIPPTNTPALAQCQNIKIYRGGTLLLSTQYNSIKPGDQLVLATVATGTTTKARYTINNGTPQETTLKNNQGEYILNYTIPMVTVPTQFKIQSEIFTNNVWR